MEERKTVKFKKDEFAIREYIKESLGKGKVSKVKISYTPIGEKIIVSTHKPGLVIGRKGEKIEELTRHGVLPSRSLSFRDLKRCCSSILARSEILSKLNKIERILK